MRTVYCKRVLIARAPGAAPYVPVLACVCVCVQHEACNNVHVHGDYPMVE